MLMISEEEEELCFNVIFQKFHLLWVIVLIMIFFFEKGLCEMSCRYAIGKEALFIGFDFFFYHFFS